MITRFLDWLDESAAGVIRVAYLLAGMIAVASYFSDGNVPRGLTHTLDAVLPWALAAALEIHTYLTARRVRGAWQDMQAATLGSEEHERAVGVMKVNLGILGGLLAFSMYNQLQYLAITWKPPHTPLTPPGPFAYLIRATIVPAAFMAAAFLAPMGEGMAVQVRAEAHRLARLAFKAASAQWKRRLRDMQRNNEDVTGALVQLVDDPTERRVIASIHAAMHPTKALVSPVIEYEANAASEHMIRSPETPPDPPEPPTPPTPTHPDDTQDDGMRSNVRELTLLPVAAASPRKRAARGDAGRPSVARAQLRARREDAAMTILAEKPEIGPRELARRVAVATKYRCSESTAHELLRSVQHKAQLAATIQEARAAYNAV